MDSAENVTLVVTKVSDLFIVLLCVQMLLLFVLQRSKKQGLNGT